jgi:group I intron endonuclease
MIGIYKITCIANNKVYIGQSANIDGRFYQHKHELKNNKHCNQHLQSSYNKYKKDFFDYKIIEIIDINEEDINEEDINEKLTILEQYYIDYYKSMDREYGFNKKGAGPKGKVTEETREKLRKAQEGRIEENRQRMIEYNKTRPPMSDENRKKLSESMSGKNNYFYSKSLKGEKAGFYGKHHSKESKAKLAKVHSRKVGKYDKITGELLEIFESARDASKSVNKKDHAAICKCCNDNMYKSCYGFIWLWYNENDDKNKINEEVMKRIEFINRPIKRSEETKIKIGKGHSKKVGKYDKITGELLEVFDSIVDAGNSLGKKDGGNISMCCTGKNHYKSSYGFIWRHILNEKVTD